MKKFFIAITLLVILLLSNVIDSRRSRSKKSKLRKHKQHDLHFLNDNQQNLEAYQSKSIRVKLKFIKGTIQAFLLSIGVTKKDLHELLQVPVKNYVKIMNILKELARKEAPESTASRITELLKTDTVPGVADKFKDTKRITEAVNGIKGFIHPGRTLKGKGSRRRRFR